MMMMMIGRVCFRWSATPRPKGSGVPALPNLGVPFYLCTDPLTQNYQIWRGNTCRGRACILEAALPNKSCNNTNICKAHIVSIRAESEASTNHIKSNPKRAELQRSPIFGVLLYLYLHNLTQNDQFRHGNQYGERRAFMRSATPLRRAVYQR